MDKEKVLSLIKFIELEIDELETDEDRFNLTYTTRRIIIDARNKRHDKIRELEEKYLSR